MDFLPLLSWWVTLQLFGFIGWPVASRLLGNLSDRGYAFGRPLGLLLSGYTLWLAGSFGLLRNNLGGLIVSMSVVLVWGLWWVWQEGATVEAPGSREAAVEQDRSPHAAPRLGALSQRLFAWARAEWRYVLAVELLFAVAFVGWAIYKAYNPNIETAGGEKWMEIAFINANLRSATFPPQDPWLSGFGISYYYFGYLLMSMITRLNGLSSISAFNLYVPTLFGLTLTTAFGIGANLVAGRSRQVSHDYEQTEDLPVPILTGPALLSGALTALYVGLLGHLEGLLEVFHARGLLPAQFWTWLDIRDLKIPPAATGDWIPERFIWWWRASRVLTDYTLTGQEQEVIDEFPFFSFLLADVHPHLLALPFVLLAVALALNLYLSGDRVIVGSRPDGNPGWPERWQAFGRDNVAVLVAAAGGKVGVLIIALCLGALGFLNTWDFPIYLLVMGLGLALWARRNAVEGGWLGPATVGTVLLGLLGGILYLPFYLGFRSQAGGLLPNLWNPTRLPQLLVFFGPFLVAAIGLLVVLSGQRNGWRSHLRWALPLTVLGPIVVLALIGASLLASPPGRQFVQGLLDSPAVQATIGGATLSDLTREVLRRRVLHPWAFLFLGGLLGWAVALWWPSANMNHLPERRMDVNDFVLGLLIVGLVLPLAVEFVYLRDNFGIRMNTVFKFYFQAWVLLALAAAYGVYLVGQGRRRLPVLVFQVVMAGLTLAGMVYPVLATLNKTSNFSREPTLNGIAWVADQYPDDYEAIMWLREHAPDDAVILEAPGSSYAAYQYVGRVSALTGVPTLLGWGNHESQWRGDYDEPARREPDIELLYNTVQPDQALTLLDKYDITYVYVGPLERQRYNEAGLRKFDRFMDAVFEQGQVKIYQRRS